MTLDIRDVRELSRPAPTIQLLTGVPKGARLEALIDGASQAGATLACFAEHTMRIETAAIVAIGVILDQERRAAPPSTQPVSSAETNAP